MKSAIGTAALMLATLLGTGLALHQAAPLAAQVPAAAADSCSRLASLRLANVTITAATSLAEGAPVANSGLSPMFGNAPVVGKAPATMCRVVGRIKPTASSDIGFEVWLPSAGWNGRLHGIGIGGFAGAIDYYALGSAVKAGQAGVATDTGHRGTMQEYGWAVGQPEKVRDYNWRGVHLSTVAAKQLVAAHYGRGADKSYFVGCSGGGRQGLMQAARFPADYDGIVAGAPAASFTDLAMAFANTVQAQNAPGGAIRTEQAKLLQEEVLRQCDGGDGQMDGLVADPRQCRFDAAKLSCSVSSSPQCFSDTQLAALRRIHAGPRNSAGKRLASGYLPSGSEAGDPAPQLGWEGYLLRGKSGKPGGEGLADGMLGALIQRPFATPANFDWDKHPVQLRGGSR
jgi:Tannase and feruloyl esterase